MELVECVQSVELVERTLHAFHEFHVFDLPICMCISQFPSIYLAYIGTSPSFHGLFPWPNIPGHFCTWPFVYTDINSMATFTLPNLPRPILPTFFQRVAIKYKRKIILRLSVAPNLNLIQSTIQKHLNLTWEKQVITMSFSQWLRGTCLVPNIKINFK